jgi:hypothetical protein
MPEARRDRDRALLEEALAGLEEPLVPFLSDALGVETHIDLVARDGAGGAVVVLLARGGRELERLGEALAQTAWLEARLGDWSRLAPELGLRPERGVRALLVARDFDERTRLAAAALGPGRVRLGRLEGPDHAPGLRLLGPAGAPAPRQAAPAQPALRSTFRTGLRDEDLASSTG